MNPLDREKTDKDFPCPRCRSDLCKQDDEQCYVCGYQFPEPSEDEEE